MPIAVGALVEIVDEQDIEQIVFLGPTAGGVKLTYAGKSIVIITPSAPLGQALMGQNLDDEIHINVGGQEKSYEITALL